MYQSFEISSPVEQKQQRVDRRWPLVLVSTIVVVTIFVAVRMQANTGASNITRRSQVEQSRRETAKQCLESFRHKLFADGGLDADSPGTSRALNTASMASSDAKIYFGGETQPFNNPEKWSGVVGDRMEDLRRALFEEHKQYPSTPRGIAITYKQDIVFINPDSCMLTGVYLGDPKSGSFHSAIAEDFSRRKSYRLVACMFCNQRHRGIRPVRGTDRIWIITSSPLSEMTISTCSRRTKFRTSLNLYSIPPVFNGGGALERVAGVKRVAKSSPCPHRYRHRHGSSSGGSNGRQIVLKNILSAKSSPVSLYHPYEIRVGDVSDEDTRGDSYRLKVFCKCANFRRDWLDLKPPERQLYSDGLRELRNNGKLAILTATHNFFPNAIQAHGSSAFLSWHRYYIWEMQRQIRRLRGRYSCYTNSYWDWTRYNTDPRTDPLFSTTDVIGGNKASNQTQNLCVASGDFTRAEGYFTPNICNAPQGDTATDVTNRTCCLKRNFRAWTLATSQTAVDIAVSYPSFVDFRPRLEFGTGMHGWAHCLINGHMCTFYSPDDPVFWLLHGYVDFLWAFWQDCHEWDKIPAAEVNSTMYRGVSPPRGDGINDTLRYAILQDQPWAYVNHTSFKYRDMHSIQAGIFKYSYDGSGLLQRSGLDISVCKLDWVNQVEESSVVSADDQTEYVAPLTKEVDDSTVKRRIQMKQQHPDWTTKKLNTELSYSACVEAKTLAEKNGKVAPCKFDKNYEKCGGKVSDPFLDISLTELLKKKGVAGNECLMGVRNSFYDWAKGLGELRELCNGMYDPSC